MQFISYDLIIQYAQRAATLCPAVAAIQHTCRRIKTVFETIAWPAVQSELRHLSSFPSLSRLKKRVKVTRQKVFALPVGIHTRQVCGEFYENILRDEVVLKKIIPVLTCRRSVYHLHLILINTTVMQQSVVLRRPRLWPLQHPAPYHRCSVYCCAQDNLRIFGRRWYMPPFCYNKL